MRKGIHIQKRTGRKRISTTLSLSKELREWLENEAAIDDVSIAFVIANVLSMISGIPSGNEVPHKQSSKTILRMVPKGVA